MNAKEDDMELRRRDSKACSLAFMVSGFNDAQRKDLGKKICQLGGSYFNDKVFQRNCTHVILADPVEQSKSEKFLAACASGKWILKESFITESSRRGTWVREEEHEWRPDDYKNHSNARVVAACHRWRFHVQTYGKLAFSGWKVAVCFKLKQQKVFKRVLLSGGAEVVDINFNQSPERYSELTYIFADLTQAATLLKMSTLDYGILVLQPEYIRDFLIQQDPLPDPTDYMYREIIQNGTTEVAPQKPQGKNLAPRPVELDVNVFLNGKARQRLGTPEHTPVKNEFKTGSFPRSQMVAGDNKASEVRSSCRAGQVPGLELNTSTWRPSTGSQRDVAEPFSREHNGCHSGHRMRDGVFCSEDHLPDFVSDSPGRAAGSADAEGGSGCEADSEILGTTLEVEPPSLPAKNLQSAVVDDVSVTAASGTDAEGDSDCEIVSVEPGTTLKKEPLSSPTKSSTYAEGDSDCEIVSIQPAMTLKKEPLSTPTKSVWKGDSVHLTSSQLQTPPSPAGKPWATDVLMENSQRSSQESPLKKRRVIKTQGHRPSSKRKATQRLGEGDVKRENQKPISDFFHPGFSPRNLFRKVPSPVTCRTDTSKPDLPRADITMDAVSVLDSEDSDSDFALAPHKTRKVESSVRTTAPSSGFYLGSRHLSPVPEQSLPSTPERSLQQLTLDGFRTAMKREVDSAPCTLEEKKVPLMPLAVSELMQLEVNDRLPFLNFSTTYLPRYPLVQQVLKFLLKGEAGCQTQPEMQPAHCLLQTLLRQHPPTTRAAVEMYRQALRLDLRENNSDVATETNKASSDRQNSQEHAWTFFKSVIEAALEIQEETWERHQRLLEYLVNLLECNLKATVSRLPAEQTYKERMLKETLVFSVFWGSCTSLGTNSKISRLFDLFAEALQKEGNMYRKARLLRSLLSLASMLARCLQLGSVGSSSGEVTHKTLEISKLVDFVDRLVNSSADGVLQFLEPSLLQSLLCHIEPPWLVLMLTQRWLASCNDSLVKEPVSLSGIDLGKIVTQYFFLLPRPSESVSGEPSKPESAAVRNESECQPNGKHGRKDKVNKRNAKGETPLHVACRRNKLDKLKEYLEHPSVDVNSKDNFGWTPLHEACLKGNLECALALLDFVPSQQMEAGLPKVQKIDPAAQSDNGTTPLHYAVETNNLELCMALLAHGGANLLHKRDQKGFTPLMCASGELREFLLKEERKLQNNHLPSADLYANVLGSQKAFSEMDIGRFIILISHLVISYLKTFVWQGSRPRLQRSSDSAWDAPRPIPALHSDSPALSSQERNQSESWSMSDLVSSYDLRRRSEPGDTSDKTVDSLPSLEELINAADQATLAHISEHVQQLKKHLCMICPKVCGEGKDAAADFLHPLSMLTQRLQLMHSDRP